MQLVAPPTRGCSTRYIRAHYTARDKQRDITIIPDYTFRTRTTRKRYECAQIIIIPIDGVPYTAVSVQRVM